MFEPFHVHAKKYKIDLKIKDKKGKMGEDYIKQGVLSGQIGHLIRDGQEDWDKAQSKKLYRTHAKLEWNIDNDEFDPPEFV